MTAGRQVAAAPAYLRILHSAYTGSGQPEPLWLSWPSVADGGLSEGFIRVC